MMNEKSGKEHYGLSSARVQGEHIKKKPKPYWFSITAYKILANVYLRKSIYPIKDGRVINLQMSVQSESIRCKSIIGNQTANNNEQSDFSLPQITNYSTISLVTVRFDWFRNYFRFTLQQSTQFQVENSVCDRSRPIPFGKRTFCLQREIVFP